MGNVSGCPLENDACWHGATAGVTLFHPKMSADASAQVISQLHAADLSALACTCEAFAAAARAVRETLDEAFYRRLCERRGWGWDSLSEVGLHTTVIAGSRLPPISPPGWLRQLLGANPRLARPHYHHMRSGVVAKCLDALGPYEVESERFERPPRWKALAEAHSKHARPAHETFVTAADVAELRKLRGLMAYMYAEGWGRLGSPETYDHVWEHVLAGRIEL